MPLDFHPVFLIVLFIVVLIIFGPGKLPELGGAAGRALREFRKTSTEITEDLTRPAAEMKRKDPEPSGSDPDLEHGTDT
jgi:sec-independent protein translocase protein TatA